MSLIRPKQNQPPAEYIIGIEAATPASGIAIASPDGRLLAQQWADSPIPASRRLLDNLDALVEEFAVEPHQVRAIAVSHGPGAFTGLRVGLALAKTLARTWQCRLYGFSTLAAMARRWPHAGDLVCPLLDARRGEVYSGCYRTTTPLAPLPERLRDDHVEPIEAFIAALAGLPDDEPIWLAGSGGEKYADALTEALGDRARWIPAHLANPAPDSLALAGSAAFARDLPGLDPLAAGPVYLRASDAERRHNIETGIPIFEVAQS